MIIGRTTRCTHFGLLQVIAINSVLLTKYRAAVRARGISRMHDAQLDAEISETPSSGNRELIKLILTSLRALRRSRLHLQPNLRTQSMAHDDLTFCL